MFYLCQFCQFEDRVMTRLFIEVYDPDGIAKITIHFACTNKVSLQVWLKSMHELECRQKATPTPTLTPYEKQQQKTYAGGGGGAYIFM